MARIRSIKPEFWRDEGVGTCSPLARLLFIATWTIADDEGLLEWSAPALKLEVFGYDAMSVAQVRELMDELTERGLILKYQAGGRTYGWILNFRRHQKIDKPQAPRHPIPSLQRPEVLEAYARRDKWVCHLCEQPIEPEDGITLDTVHERPPARAYWPSNVRCAHASCAASKTPAPDTSENGRDLSPNGRDLSTAEGKGREGSREEGIKEKEEGGGGGRAREAAPSDSWTDDELLDRVMNAAGVVSPPVPTYWLPPAATLHVAGWRRDLGIPGELIVEAVRRKQEHASRLPAGPKAFDATMTALAGEIFKPRLVADPLRPAGGGGGYKSLDADDILRLMDRPPVGGPQ